MKNEFNELVFHVWKTSPLNSFSYQILSRLLGLRLHLIRSCVAWSFVVFVVKKSIQGKRVHWTRFLIRSCSVGCLIRSGCVCTWWLRQDQIVSSTWWRTWSDWAASALDVCVCTWSNRVSDGALDQIMFVVFVVKKKVYKENEFNELVFLVWKTSSLNSFSMYGRQVQWTRFSLYTFSTQILVK